MDTTDAGPYDEAGGFGREHDFLAMTRYELEEHLAENGLVVIPTGSVEQHGHHLPVGTDAYAVRAIAERVAGALDGLLIPFTAMGVTPLHAGMAGAIDLQGETFMALLKDVCASLIDHGADQIVVVNWHEVNTPFIEAATTDLQQEYREVRFVLAQAHFTARDLYADYHDLTHGGPLEVLPVLGARPDTVHLDRATDAADEGHASRMDDLRRSDRVYPIIPDVRIMYPSGWYGDLDGVTPELAAEFLDRVAEACAEEVAETLEIIESVDYRVGLDDDA